jgi:hypothetical protein
MQIILTEEEYNLLRAKDGGGIVDYQRKFRLALGHELIRANRHACGLSMNDIKTAVDRAEEIAKRIQ